MARPEKVAAVETITDWFKEARSVVLNDFTGLDVEKISQLRRLCRERNVEYHVVKNTLAKLGIKQTDAAELDPFFEGPTAIAISRESENEAAKVLGEFAKENELPRFKAGFVDGNVIDATAVLALSTLPSKAELVSMLLAGIKGPANGIVGVLQGPLRNLVSVLNQIKEQKQ
jgi:large subunit ribosomal protein L10